MKHKMFTTHTTNKGVPQIRPSNRFYYATALSSCVLERVGLAVFFTYAAALWVPALLRGPRRQLPQRCGQLFAGEEQAVAIKSVADGFTLLTCRQLPHTGLRFPHRFP
jgi:hypothetical protein